MLRTVYNGAIFPDLKITILMYARSLFNSTHNRRFTVRPADAMTGWEIRDEIDARVLKSIHYQDWHRVERAKAIFALEANALKDHGWTEG